MVTSFYDNPDLVVPENPDLEGKWTPAEVNQILFRNFGAPEQGIQDLVSLTHRDLYGFTDPPPDQIV